MIFLFLLIKLSFCLSPSLHIDSFNAFFKACNQGDVSYIRECLDKGVSVCSTYKGGWTPLHIASFRGHVEIVKLLLERGAPLEVMNEFGALPISYACYYHHNPIVELILMRQLDENVGGYYESLLYCACQRGYLKAFRLLFRPDMNLYCQNSRGQTLLHVASLGGYVDIIQLLLSYVSIDCVEQLDFRGKTALDYASERQYIDAVCLLLDAYLPNQSEDSYLHIACRKQHVQSVFLLIGWHFNLHLPNREGQTGLHIASQNGSFDIVELILMTSQRLGVNQCLDLDLQDNQGRTALDLAIQGGHSDIVSLLRNQKGKLSDVKNQFEEKRAYPVIEETGFVVQQFLGRIQARSKKNKKNPPFSIVSKKCQVKTVSSLKIKKGRDLNIQEESFVFEAIQLDKIERTGKKIQEPVSSFYPPFCDSDFVYPLSYYA